MVCLLSLDMLLFFLLSFALVANSAAASDNNGCVHTINEMEVETQFAILTTILQITGYAETLTMEATQYTDFSLTLTLYEEAMSSEMATEQIAYDAIEEFITEYEHEAGTLYSGETTADTTSYSTLFTSITSTTDILRIKNGYSLETSYETVTEYVTEKTTQYHFTDISMTTTLITTLE